MSSERLIQTILHSTDLQARYRAVLELGLGGDESIAPLLVEIMYHDTELSMRQMAAWAAGQLALRSCIPALEVRLTAPQEDEQMRFIAAMALLRLNLEESHQIVKNHAASSDDAVQRAAGAALRAIPFIL